MHAPIGFFFTVFASFLTGHFLHVFLQATHAKQSKLDGIASYAQYLAVNGYALSTRFVGETVGMLWWMRHPDALTTLVQWAGKKLLPGDFPASLLVFGLGVPEAFGIGFAADSVLRYASFFAARIPGLEWLAREVPPAKS